MHCQIFLSLKQSRQRDCLQMDDNTTTDFTASATSAKRHGKKKNSKRLIQEWRQNILSENCPETMDERLKAHTYHDWFFIEKQNIAEGDGKERS